MEVTQGELFIQPDDICDPDTADENVGGTAKSSESSAAMSKWTLDYLMRVCEHKRISCRESDHLTTVEALVVRSGSVTRISLRTDLTEAEKIAALAHELGHVALDNIDVVAFHPKERVSGNVAEDAAAIWASHLLVKPAVWEQSWKEAFAISHDKIQAKKSAISVTSVRLGIPSEVVETWDAHRDACFAEAPGEWIAHP